MPLSFAYPLFCTIAGIRGKLWKALRAATARADAADTNREAGRKSRDILVGSRSCEKEIGKIEVGGVENGGVKISSGRCGEAINFQQKSGIH